MVSNVDKGDEARATRSIGDEMNTRSELHANRARKNAIFLSARMWSLYT